MFKNYVKTAWRSLVNNRVYSALNILGLATGMAVALIIGLWIYYQFSFDRFLPGHNLAYKVRLKVRENGETFVGPATPMPLAEAIKRDIPQVRYVAQADWGGPHSLVVGDRKLYPNGLTAGGDFLKIFAYPLLEGNPDDVLRDPHAIVLTESTAKALFGNADPLGKTVRIDNGSNLQVTGVLKDLPDNSTFQFHFLVPFSFLLENSPGDRESLENWRNYSYQTFIALRPNVSPAQASGELKGLIKKYDPADYAASKTEAFPEPMDNWHLYTRFENGIADGGLIDYIKMFSIIGILVLLIACINFMNLSTARSEKRAREVGIRKAIGSQRKDLIFQFLIESLSITFVSFIIALFLVQLALPSFRTLTGTAVDIPYSSGIFWLLMLSYVVLTGLVSGARPALYLSGFQPVKVLKGAVHTGAAGALPRKALVVLQFTCSIALITSTIIIYRQIQHAKDRPIGYDADRLLMSDANNDLNRQYAALKNDLLQSGVVTSVTKSSSPATDIWSNQRIDDWQGKLPGETLGLATIGVCDADYFKTLGISFSQGRNFAGNPGEDSLSVVLNEAAVKRMRFQSPLNQVITWHDRPQRIKVIGIVKNALMTSPFSPVEPTIFIYAPDWANVITYRLAPTINTQVAIGKLTQIFNKYSPSYPYTYDFVDKSYAAKFDLEMLIGRLSGLFAALTVFISCLGLFGLAAYMAEQRTKEIGIRKVLGASVSQVWLLLSKDFVVLVIISCVIATPIAFYFLHGWLLKYEYRITIGPGVFLVSSAMALLITIATISFQAIRAAIANPANSLRTE